MGYRTIPPPEYKTRYPCKCITTCLSGPSAAYLLVLYLFVFRDHALSHIRMFSICICRDHGIRFPFVYLCPRLPEMRGGDDLAVAVELRITKIHLPKRVHIAKKRLRKGVSAVPPSPSQKVAKGCQIASGNTER